MQPFHPRTPNQLDRDFQLLSPLSEGPTGTVWRAEERATAREVSIKILGGDVVVDAQGLIESAQKLLVLDHPSMARNLTVVSTGTPWFIVREFVEGQPLGETLAGQPLEVAKFFRLADQVTSAVAQAHDRGLIHGNIRSDNVILDRPNTLLHLTGWGLVKRGYARQSLGKPENLSYLTPREVAAIAPEQILGETPDAQSDVFSLGVLFYQMLTGRAPFSGATSLDILTSILSSQPPDPRQYNQNLPSALVDLLSSCLLKDRRQRPASAAQVLAELKRTTGFTEAEKVPIKLAPPKPKVREATFLLAAVSSSASSGGVTLRQRNLLDTMIWTPVLENEGSVADALSSTFTAEFPDAGKALKAAQAARLQIDRYNASHSGAANPLRVAMVLHTGDVIDKDSVLTGPAIQLAAGALRCVPTIQVHLSEPAAIAAGFRFKARPWTIFNGDRFYALDVTETARRPWQILLEKQKKLAAVAAGLVLTTAAALALTVTVTRDAAAPTSVSPPPRHQVKTSAAPRVRQVVILPFESSSSLRASTEVLTIRSAVISILKTVSVVEVTHSNGPYASEVGARVINGASTELVPFVRTSSTAREGSPVAITDGGAAVVNLVGWTMTQVKAGPPPSLNAEAVNAYLKALGLANSGDSKSALVAIDDSLKIDPNFVAARSMKAELLDSMARRDEATETGKLLALKPGHRAATS